MDVLEKLSILTDAAKYDAACTSSGVRRGSRPGMIGNTSSSIAGCCHSFSADGRCITLLKVLITNVCTFDCRYCVNRRSNDTRRAAFTPRELAELTIGFYRRNYIEGLFLSSGVLRSPDYTTEQMICALRILRQEYRFNGYIHAKAIPGTSPELVQQLGLLADRLSVNIELPSQSGLQSLAPDKTKDAILHPADGHDVMRFIELVRLRAVIVHEKLLPRLLVLQGEDEVVALHVRRRCRLRQKALDLDIRRSRRLRLLDADVRRDRIGKTPASIADERQQEHDEQDLTFHDAHLFQSSRDGRARRCKSASYPATTPGAS